MPHVNYHAVCTVKDNIMFVCKYYLQEKEIHVGFIIDPPGLNPPTPAGNGPL